MGERRHHLDGGVDLREVDVGRGGEVDLSEPGAVATGSPLMVRDDPVATAPGSDI
jgi:hypothetical protein